MAKTKYGARVKDTGPDPKWDGDWFRIRTTSNYAGEWSTRKGAQAALDSALSHGDELVGHVFTYKKEPSKPTANSVDVSKWLYGNITPVKEAPLAHREEYRHTLRLAALAASRYGHRVYVSSSLRTRGEQIALYNKYLAGGPLAARPGTSLHEKGLALDIPNVRDNKPLLKQMRKVGLFDDVPSEKWHLSRH